MGVAVKLGDGVSVGGNGLGVNDGVPVWATVGSTKVEDDRGVMGVADDTGGVVAVGTGLQEASMRKNIITK